MTPAATIEDQIRAMLDERVPTRACAPDIVSYDALPTLQRLGVAAARARAEEWLGWYDGPGRLVDRPRAHVYPL